MTLDPRAPVIVGVAQSLRRPTADDVAEQSEPADMMVEVLRLAAQDAGPGERLLRAADSIRVIEMLSWRYADAAAVVAERLGSAPRETVVTTTGGNSPQMLVNDTAAAIQRGEIDIALIAGAEAIYTRLLARKADVHLEWTALDAGPPAARVIGSNKPGTNDAEMARGIVMPTQVYPMFENALRAASGETIDAHQVKVSDLWARFSACASENAHAWSPTPRTSEEIRTVTAENRMIGFPYPKLMNSNIQTDQAAALIMCSVAAARGAGVPEDRWVFVHSGADANDQWFISERENLSSSPAIAANGRVALELAGVALEEIGYVDLYSCFPAAVQIGAAALGLGLDEPERALTVTGGLCFAGGPGNNYVTHSIASMVDQLRGDPGAYGLVTALGWYLTKHSIGIYATTPPPDSFRHASPQSEVDALPRRDYVADHEGDVTVETYTVMHERDGAPANALVACLLPDGRRTWATSTDVDLLVAMTTEEFCGRPARVAAGGTLHVQ